MSHFLHHYFWLLRRFRRVLFYYLTGWALLMVAVWTLPQYFYAANVLFSLHGVLAAIAIGLILAVVWQDPAPGTDTFWRTRPPRWRAVWGSQLVFSLVCVAGPFVACWLVNGLMLGCNPRQWQAASQDLVLVLSSVLVLGGVVSFSRGWYSLITAGIAAYGLFLLGIFFMIYYWQVEIPDALYTRTRQPLWVIPASVLPAAAGLVAWGMGLRRHGRLLRGAILSLLIAGGPISLWPLIQPQPPESRSLELVRAELATESERRAQPGNLVLRGLPQGTAWLPSFGYTTFSNPGGRIEVLNPPRSNGGGYELASVNYYPPGIQNFKIIPRTLPAEPVKDLLGTGTQLYANIPPQGSSDEPKASGWYVAWNVGITAPITVTGTERGLLYRLTPLASVPLEEGASAAERGTRLHVRSVTHDGQNLHVLADMHFATRLLERFLPPMGEAMPIYRSFVPVLHFPSGEFAILMGNSERYSDPRSLLTTSQQLNLYTSVPAPEAIQGLTFTPELLRGARLHLFSFITEGPADVVCRDQIFTPESIMHKAGSAADLYAKLAGQRDASAIEAARQLTTMGTEAARGLLAREWPQRSSLLYEPFHYGADFWKKLIAPELLPDLTAAMRRDPRWIPVAWIIGREDLAAEPAMEHLKKSRSLFQPWLLASAARIIQPEDYPLFSRSLPGAPGTGYGQGKGEALILLWQRLRALPGFDWKAAACTHWRDAWLSDTDRDSTNRPLRAAAALAGETTAFNSLLEDEQAPREKPGGSYAYTLPAADWEVLHTMIHGLPADPAARPAWLREKRGHFKWDETTGRYHLPAGP